MRYLKKRATFRGSHGPWVALLHADGKLPNLALMRLATYYRGHGYGVRLVRAGEKRPVHLARPVWTFGSSIFDFSGPTRALLERDWGPVAWGGTGIWRYDEKNRPIFTGPTLETIDPTVEWRHVAPDYMLYPDFTASLGFTQRGCRLSCHFCVVPKKEGKPAVENSLDEIWRGEGHPRRIVLLDNDFFGQQREAWRERVRELRGDPSRADAPRKGLRSEFRVNFNQGINVRMIDEESASAVASLEYRDVDFSQRRLYVAWDNLPDEAVFKKGVALLDAAGVPAKHIMSYMLVGYRKGETFEEVMYRFEEIRKLGALPYPMPHDRKRAATCRSCRDLSGRTERCPDCGGDPDPVVRDEVRRLLRFARWVSTGLYRTLPWKDYNPHLKAQRTAARKAAAT